MLSRDGHVPPLPHDGRADGDPVFEVTHEMLELFPPLTGKVRSHVMIMFLLFFMVAMPMRMVVPVVVA